MNRAALLLFTALPPAALAATCDSMNSLKVPNATIRATSVAAGAYTQPGAVNAKTKGPGFGDLPAFCAVRVVSKPSADSVINIEYWLPESGWNGNFLANEIGRAHV